MPEGRGDGPRRAVDHFAVLGLTPEASDADIRRAYRGLARDSHPDRGGDAEQFARISSAYEALRGPGARERVALELRVQARRDEMARGSSPTGGSSSRTQPPPSRPRPASSGSSRPASRLSQAEQDRLIDEFLRSHPEARQGSRASAGRAAPTTAAGRAGAGRAGAGRASGRAPRRRPRRVRGVLVALVAVVALGVVAQPLLPEPVQEAVSGWVDVVSP